MDYALGDVSLGEIYGDNVARGRAIAAQYDPAKVMCLAGASVLPALRAEISRRSSSPELLIDLSISMRCAVHLCRCVHPLSEAVRQPEHI